MQTGRCKQHARAHAMHGMLPAACRVWGLGLGSVIPGRGLPRVAKEPLTDVQVHHGGLPLHARGIAQQQLGHGAFAHVRGAHHLRSRPWGHDWSGKPG